jgi:hypothetical protein
MALKYLKLQDFFVHNRYGYIFKKYLGRNFVQIFLAEM